MIEGKKKTNKEEENEKAIDKMITQITESNKKTDDIFDERIKQLDIKKKLTPDEKIAEKQELKLETLKTKLSEIKEMITNARKEGKDPFIANHLGVSITQVRDTRSFLQNGLKVFAADMFKISA